MKVRGTSLSMIRGDTETLTVACQNTAGEAVPFVDGDIVYFTVKKSVRDEEKALQKIVTDFLEGEAIIEIYPEDTKHLNFGKYVYDVQLTKANGDIFTIVPASGFSIEGEVTYE